MTKRHKHHKPDNDKREPVKNDCPPPDNDKDCPTSPPDDGGPDQQAALISADLHASVLGTKVDASVDVGGPDLLDCLHLPDPGGLLDHFDVA